MPLIVVAAAGRRVRHRGGRAVRHPVACASRACTSRWPRWRRSSSSTGPSCASSGSPTIRRRARSAWPTCKVFGLPIETPVEKYLFCLAFLMRVRAAGQEPGARPHRPRVDGHPRHGRGRRGDRHPPGLRQAHARLPSARFIVGVAGALWGFVHLGSWEPAAFNDRPLVPAAVHGHHRRPGLDHGQLLRRGLHRGAADLPQRKRPVQDHAIEPTSKSSRSRRTAWPSGC